MRVGWISAALLLVACSLHTPVPQARVRPGPAFDTELRKVLALPTSCYAENEALCTPAQVAAVDGVSRMALEFAGLRLVDSEVVNAYLRQRVTKTVDGVSRSEVDDDESTWESATEDTRRRLLTDMGIDGYLTTEIEVGAVKNLENQRTITVTIKVIRANDLADAWTSRCSIETGRFYHEDEAVEIATRCALESALMVGA